MAEPRTDWGRRFDPDRLADLEFRMWQAYYRRQPVRLFGLLVRANRELAGVGWPRAVQAAFRLARAAIRFGRAQGDYDRFEPGIAAGYRALRLPPHVDVTTVARRELRWWVVRREIGVMAGSAAGDAITALYAALYDQPEADVAEAGRLRGEAAEVRDRGAADDPDGPYGPGLGYWPEVERLLHASYRSLHAAVGQEGSASGATADILPFDEGATRLAAANDYHFVTTWRLPATPEEISAVLGDAEQLARWWPSVYLDVRVVEPGSPDGVGRVVALYTKGWLPYTLHWRFRVTSADAPHGFRLDAEGDLVGRGEWIFTAVRPGDDPAGPLTEVIYDWRVLAAKGVLRHLSFLMKPLFAANHRWAMASGERSLLLELARRHAADDPALLAVIPPPPGPTFPDNFIRRGRAR
jgi:Polyketide cyclase / dehydrase and lipid transport